MKLDRPLEGERIVIRSYAPEDLDFCTGMWFDPENGRYLSDPAREYVDEVFQQALDGLQDSGYGYYLVVERKVGGERIGTCCAFPDEAGKAYDIGYCVHRSCWRQGLAGRSWSCCWTGSGTRAGPPSRRRPPWRTGVPAPCWRSAGLPR